MTRRMLSVYLLRARDAAQSTFTQPLLNRTNEPNSDLDSTVATDTISKPLNKITIRIKSGDSTIESDTDDDQSGTVQDPLASCIHNHQCLSPSKRSAKALIYFLYMADLAIGLYLTVFSLQKQSEDDYGIIMMSLTAGLLLIGGSVAGICLHTPLGALFCNDDTDVNRSLMIFNTSFAFIGVGIYYLVRASVVNFHATLPFVHLSKIAIP